jgi:hypothetical protein
METKVNHCNPHHILFAIALGLAIIFISGCLGEESSKTVKLGDIIANPALYNGKTVIIEGKYGGWGGNITCSNNPVMMTRSDSLIYDGDECLYMIASSQNGIEILYKENELNPTNFDSIGTKIKIKAVVSLIDGKPILGKIE